MKATTTPSNRNYTKRVNPDNIVFRKPPVKRTYSRNSPVKRFLAAIATRPNEWAVFAENVSPSYGYVCKSKYSKMYPDTEWKVVAENPAEPTTRTVFVRVKSKTVK